MKVTGPGEIFLCAGECKEHIKLDMLLRRREAPHHLVTINAVGQSTLPFFPDGQSRWTLCINHKATFRYVTGTGITKFLVSTDVMQPPDVMNTAAG